MEDHSVCPMKAHESATTRDKVDLDEIEHEHEQEAVTSLIPSGHGEIPPQKPPRPLSPQVYAENTLLETFLSIDTKVVKAVLAASARRSSTAATATAQQILWRAPQNQLEADELYARRLAEQYDSDTKGQATYNQREPSRRGRNQQRPYYDEDDRDHSFFDDDLPEIGRNFQQRFVETQSRVNGWIYTFRKKSDGEADKDDLYTSSKGNSRQGTDKWQGRQNFGPSQSEQMYGLRKSAEQARRSTEMQRYDADPHEFDEDSFERLALRDDDAPPPRPPRTLSRGKANQDLFKPQPKPLQSGPVDEVDAAERRALLTNQDPDKTKKWQPLTSIAPHPDEDNNPFSLRDDEEDKSTTSGKRTRRS
ncbi:ubiquitin-binding protein cue5 [Friedmanniomyces endolithicus]|uniref:Ubiquitin-binding protein cue5 n=1 Tax=Rachicladosporium monterosium TaxID=1507873 RepID=A0ABR0LAC4_9PEZI|nr:ubiquitin-binding protein cue5 [Friedmanniomyces endolithicus]KAK5145921.1 ubiquitin-binding protein cue5 [Rachicladosporium monterosium]